MSLVSVVLPLHDTRPFVRRAVESALGQTHEAIEVVVVDDGSSDGGAEEIRDLVDAGRVRLIRQPNRGTAAARNTGWRASRGEHLLFLDSDDEVDGTIVEKLLPLLEPSRPRRFAYSEVCRIDENGETIAGLDRMIAGCRLHLEGNLLPSLAFAGFLQTHCMLVPRGLVEEARGFDERFGHCEDFHFWLRLFALGATARFLPEPLARYRLRPGSRSSVAEEMRRWTVAALDDVAREYPAAIGAALPSCHDEFEWIRGSVRAAGEEHVVSCAAQVRRLEAELDALGAGLEPASPARETAVTSGFRTASSADRAARSPARDGGRGPDRGSTRRRPLVSIVVTGDPRTVELRETVESAVGQTYPRIEVVVAEVDGAEGGAAAVAAARNAGIGASSGELVVLLPSGARLAAHMVEGLAARLEPGDPWSFAYSDYRRLDADGAPIPADDYAVSLVRSALEGDLLASLLPAPFFPVHGALVPRALIDRLGGFDSRFAGREDLHFWLRAACEGVRARFVDAPLSTVSASALEEDGCEAGEATRRVLADVAARYPEAVAAAFGRMHLEAARETGAIWLHARRRLDRLESRARELETALAERRARIATLGASSAARAAGIG